MFTRVVAFVFALALIVAPSSSHAASHHLHLLTTSDRQIGFSVSRLAEYHPAAAVRRLRTRAEVSRADLGPDGRTIEVMFRDGASLVILPRIPQPAMPHLQLAHLRTMARVRQAAGQPVKAAVLEPFANELGFGPNAGQPVADLLTKAGFAVDVYRDSQVTVPLMERLSQYAVVYVLSHSGALGGGHAFILLGETDQKPYTSLLSECESQQPRLCSLQQGIAAGDTHDLWVGITDLFIQRHMGDFPNSSIVFLNGCGILSAPVFINAWHAKNVASLIGWDKDVDSGITELTALVSFQDLANGLTVDASLQDVTAKGLGTSDVNQQTAHLLQDGYGNDTLSQALAGSTPIVTPTASPTITVTPTVTPRPTAKPSKSCPKNSKKKHGKCLCKTGYTMKKGKCVKKK